MALLILAIRSIIESIMELMNLHMVKNTLTVLSPFGLLPKQGEQSLTGFLKIDVLLSFKRV